MIGAPRALLTSLFHAAIEAADPHVAIARHLPQRPKGRTVLVAAGKAASQMAAAFEAAWDGPLDGLAVARYGPVAECRRTRILQAAHPVPDRAGLLAAEALMNHVRGLNEDDLVVALISGGGSALLPAPPIGLTLADEIALNKALLASGAPISAMNVVRKHFSRIKGGRLAALAAPARVVTLIVSDVPGDHAAFVASGPTVPDETTAREAIAVVENYRLPLGAAVIDAIRNAVAPKPADPAFAGNEVHIIASARVSLDAAGQAARQSGLTPLILSDAIEGEAREIGRMHAALAREFAVYGTGPAQPAVLLSGGETTVTLDAERIGKGGRNTEFLLAAALDLDGVDRITALSADTDGIDGTEENAGAFCDGATAARIRAAGGDPRALLARHDAWSAFSLAGDLFTPGPTGTNVNDFRAFLIG
ncbi:hydroxypyruvate reductase [Xaviernesmea oryzae]|uniref:Hydroxypyruvate reductase n=1 Tax=Xaviernesmea oryzae TaxID=464029 RepID=A0A1Q9B390_9HYPH|nr:glycerate kinase [Xaviernesmea oryzae]OLP62470.1 hydroxypyruvate reductase [Xaviernesmea oryzae]SEM17517.1 glycerate 2-kinase [Xaviernesmea oryzae]